jgi:hypothetical protein
MRFVALMLATGCMTGIGPTLAIRPDNGHATIGLEGSEDFSGIGFNQGLIFDDDRILPYVDIHGYMATNGNKIGDNGLQDNATSYVGASIGATKVPTGGEVMFGAWVMGARASHVDCSRGDTVLTITAGIRYRNGLEIFVTPKGYYRDGLVCFD